MSIGLILLVVVVIWWVMSSSRSHQARQLATRREELETWEHTDSDEIASHTFRLHFPTMRLVADGVSYEPGIPDGPKLLSEVRRTDSGKWEMRLTTESWRERLREAEKRLGERKFDSFWKEQVEELRKGPQWTGVSDSMNSSIEAAYQRFVHQRP
jgi:hypothetical protein